jgi:5-methylcytosine-specific restriction endonuclease McrA
MKRFNSPCLYCGVISRGGVCRQCRAAIESKDIKRRERNRAYDYEWNKLSRLARQIQENIMVLCRRCNSSKG